MSGVLVQVYRSPRRADTYLLTEKASGLTAVPEALFGTFGDPLAGLSVCLSPCLYGAAQPLHVAPIGVMWVRWHSSAKG